jgi:hypothetical protein
MRRLRLVRFLGVCLLLFPIGQAFAQTQEPPPPTAPADSAPKPPVASSSKPASKRYSHANDFLIRGTVFDDKALSFPAVQLRVRRAGEKKFRWESFTNSRGEFAIRVPQGSEYEMVVHTKGYQDQTRKFDAKSGTNEESAVFRMERIAGEKK